MQSSMLSSSFNTIYEKGYVSFTILLLNKLFCKNVFLPTPSSPEATMATGVPISKSSILCSKSFKNSFLPTNIWFLSLSLGCFSYAISIILCLITLDAFVWLPIRWILYSFFIHIGILLSSYFTLLSIIIGQIWYRFFTSNIVSTLANSSWTHDEASALSDKKITNKSVVPSW